MAVAGLEQGDNFISIHCVYIFKMKTYNKSTISMELLTAQDS